MLGIPTRIEIGPKDIENGQVVVVRRDTREKIVVAIDEITTKLGEILETIQKDLYAKAKAFLDDHISTGDYDGRDERCCPEQERLRQSNVVRRGRVRG